MHVITYLWQAETICFHIPFKSLSWNIQRWFKIYLNICLVHIWVILWSSSVTFIYLFFFLNTHTNSVSLLPAYTGISNLTSIFAALARLMIFESLTAIFAASSRLSQGKILRLDSAMRAFASSTLVPYWEKQCSNVLTFHIH